MSSFEQLVFEIIAKDAQASAAFDRFRARVDATSGSVDKNSVALDKNTSALDRNAKGNRSALGTAIGLGTAFAAMSAPLTAATVGVSAFGLFAAPAVMKVTKALTGPGGLAGGWAKLDPMQRTVALGVQDLIGRYDRLAAAMAPRTLQVFSSGLTLANSLLGPTARLAAAAGTGIESFLVHFTQTSGIQQFIGFLASQAAPALTLAGADITNIAHAVFVLLESFGGVGMAELKLFSAVLSGLTGSITWLSEHAGGLTGVALGIAGIAVALAKIGALSSVLRLTGLTAAAVGFMDIAMAAGAASVAEKGLMATQVALESITPFGWALLGVAALGGLLYATRNMGSGTQALVATMAKQDEATGLNVAGYQRLDRALSVVTAAQGAQLAATVQASAGWKGSAGAVNVQAASLRVLTAAQQAAADKAANLQQDIAGLAAQYGLTAGQARSLIVSSGTLNELLAANGKITPDVAAKIKAWAGTEAQGATITNSAAIAVTALTNAMAKNIGTVLTLQGDENAYQVQLAATNKQVASNSAGMAGNSANAVANRGQVIALTNSVVTFATAQLTSRKNLAGASQEIQAQIRYLQALHDKSGFATAQIQALAAVLRQIKSEQAVITVSGSGHWDVVGPGGPGHHVGKLAAAGWRVPGYGGGDRWPALLEGGEAVVPKHLTPAVAPFLRAAGVPGFSAGGVAGSFSGSVPGLTSWLGKVDAATLLAIENATAAGVLRGIQASAASAASAGSAGAPGGGNAAANAALARQMMPAWGSGAAWAAWNDVAMRESGWNQFARNPSSGAYGIPQALPPTKMPFAAQAAGGSHPGAQISWMIGYMSGAYGGPQGAAAHEAAFGWYDQGGFLPPGLSLAYNGTGRPERVGGDEVTVRLEWVGGTPGDDFMAWLRGKIRVKAGRGPTSVQQALS